MLVRDQLPEQYKSLSVEDQNLNLRWTDSDIMLAMSDAQVEVCQQTPEDYVAEATYDLSDDADTFNLPQDFDKWKLFKIGDDRLSVLDLGQQPKSTEDSTYVTVTQDFFRVHNKPTTGTLTLIYHYLPLDIVDIDGILDVYTRPAADAIAHLAAKKLFAQIGEYNQFAEANASRALALCASNGRALPEQRILGPLETTGWNSRRRERNRRL